MGIDVNEIKIIVQTIVICSLKTSYRLVQNRPYVSCISFFFILLYVFLPSFHDYLCYTSPILFCTSILLTTFWTSKHSKFQAAKGEHKSRSIGHNICVNKNDRSSSQAAKGNVKSLVAAKNIQAPDYNNRIKGSEISQHQKHHNGNESETKSFSDKAEDEDEEETQEDRNKALEWIQDDQKNLMDLGFSEIERNRRLESLIAKRRARKSFERKIEKGLINIESIPASQIAKVLLTKSDPFDDQPGSAPSILLPMRSPFDIPYDDPLEEKLNLMADSFHQEFTVNHQKDWSPFCRHESFSYGPSLAIEPMQDRPHSKFSPFYGYGGAGYPGSRRAFGYDKRDDFWLSGLPLPKGRAKPPVHVLDVLDSEHDDDKETKQASIGIKESEKENSQKKQILPDTKSELQMDLHDESSSSSSLEFPETIFYANNIAGISQSSEAKLPNSVLDSLASSIPNSQTMKETLYDSSPNSNENNNISDISSYSEKGACHTPICSTASDLVVEVSELGSPPLTNATNSPSDRESLVFDGDIESWSSSSDLLKVAEKELKSREAYELNESILNNVGCLGINKNSKDLALPARPPPHEVVSEKPKDSSNPHEKHKEEENTNIHIKDPTAKANGSTENVKINDDKYSGVDNLIKKQTYGELIVNQAISDSVQQTEGNKNLNQIKSSGEVEKLSVHDSKTNISKPSETKEHLKTVQDSADKQNILETGVSLVNQSSNDLIVPARQKKLVTEEIPPFVHEQIPKDLVSSSSSTVSPQSDLNDMGKAISSDKQAAPQTNQNLAENSKANPSNFNDSVKFQEPVKPQKKPTEKAKVTGNLVEKNFDDKVAKENSEFSNSSKKESETLLSNKAAVELSNSAKEAHYESIEDTKNMSVKPIECEKGHGPLELRNGSTNSYVPEIIRREDKNIPTGEVAKESKNIVYHPMNRDEAMLSQSKPMGESNGSNTLKVVEENKDVMDQPRSDNSKLTDDLKKESGNLLKHGSLTDKLINDDKPNVRQ